LLFMPPNLDRNVILGCMSVELSDNPELNRYEVRVDGELVGFAQYRIDGAQMTIFHTEVDAAHQRQSVGSQLAKHALDDVRARGLQLAPTCPFIADYVRRHPDLYLEIVSEPLRDQVMAGS
jgi:predicted GNAT family acetyltransferase